MNFNVTRTVATECRAWTEIVRHETAFPALKEAPLVAFVLAGCAWVCHESVGTQDSSSQCSGLDEFRPDRVLKGGMVEQRRKRRWHGG